MKTAIEQLKEDFKSPLLYLEMMKVAIDWDKYLEIEKKQIIDAYNIGFKVSKDLGAINPSIDIADDYYNQAHNQNK
jgi:hypothetical protein